MKLLLVEFGNGSRAEIAVDGRQSGGEYAVVRYTVKPGDEPPLHTHSREDEMVFVVDGEITALVGDTKVDVGRGAFAALPRGVPHSIHDKGASATLLLTLVPAGLERFFVPASENDNDPATFGLELNTPPSEKENQSAEWRQELSLAKPCAKRSFLDWTSAVEYVLTDSERLHTMTSYSSLLREVRDCTLCESHLPLGPRPVLQLHPKAKVLVAGQAPGRKVHESGVPFDDASGNRLREWLGVTREVFYDSEQIAILPMGFCFPGSGKSGDLPPRHECAPEWRKRLLGRLRHLEVTLVLGRYAQAYHFGEECSSLTELVKSWRSYWPQMVPLPHPSPRNNLWLRRNPWFEVELLPSLRKCVSEVLAR